MKTMIIGAIAALSLTATTVAANELAWTGTTEYGIESQVFEVEVGAEYVIDQFYIAPSVRADNALDGFDFTGGDIELGYIASQNVDVYVRVEFDNDFNYDETVLGVSFRF